MDEIKWLLEVKDQVQVQATRQVQQQRVPQENTPNGQNQYATPSRESYGPSQQRGAQGQPLPYYQQSQRQDPQLNAPTLQRASDTASSLPAVNPSSEAHKILISIAPQIKMQLEMLCQALAEDDLEKAKTLRDRVLDGWGA